MNSYRFNQIAMAVLAALLLFFGTRTIIGIINEPPEQPEKAPAPKKVATEKPAGPSLPELLQHASVTKGKADVAICEACHNLKKGGPNMVGPNLYGVLGRKIGSHPGYAYSKAVKDKGGVWTFAKINKMITKPAAFIPGTKMSIFPGIPDAKKRADILVYLRTLNDNPPPLPKVTKTAAASSGPSAAAPKKASEPEILKLLPTASAAKGKQDVAICKMCHNLQKGGPNMVGPNLYGVVDRPVGSHPGYAYSEAVKKHGGKWTYVAIDEMITDPAKHIPGTKMSIFPGIKNAKKRADIIAYLRTLSDHPAPLPGAASKPTAPAKAPAEKPAATPPAKAPAASAEKPAATPPAKAPAAPAEKPAATPPASGSDMKSDSAAPNNAQGDSGQSGNSTPQ